MNTDDWVKEKQQQLERERKEREREIRAQEEKQALEDKRQEILRQEGEKFWDQVVQCIRKKAEALNKAEGYTHLAPRQDSKKVLEIGAYVDPSSMSKPTNRVFIQYTHKESDARIQIIGGEAFSLKADEKGVVTLYPGGIVIVRDGVADDTGVSHVSEKILDRVMSPARPSQH